MSQYRGLTPTGFFECLGSPSCPSAHFLSCFHAESGITKEFCIDRICDVYGDIDLLEALMGDLGYDQFWLGNFSSTETTELSSGLIQSVRQQTDFSRRYALVEEWLDANLPCNKTIIAGPNTDIEHKCYAVTIEGIILYFDEVDRSVILTIIEMITGAKLPGLLKAQLFGIQMVAEYARGGPDVVAMMGDGIVTVFGGRDADMGIIAHEVAHEFAVQKWGNPMPPSDTDYYAAIRSGEPAVSQYGKKNDSEDFAEAVRMYVEDLEQLQMDYPKRYAVIDRLMKDPAYGG